MSTLIKFDFRELKQLANDKQSCVVEKTVTQNIALEPWCLGNLKESIKNLLDYKIGKFVKELNGILLSFKNLRILQNVGAIRNDNSVVNFQVQADYFIFQPYIGATLKGIVTKKTISHLVVLIYRVFKIIIPRPTEEHENTWLGLNVQENQEVAVKVIVLDLFGALPYIRGELDARYIKLGQCSVEATLESNNTKTIDMLYQQKSDENQVPSAKNYTCLNHVSTKVNSPIDNTSTYQEIEVHLDTTKSKNKRHKDHTQKYYDSDIKQINPKLKHIKHTEG